MCLPKDRFDCGAGEGPGAWEGSPDDRSPGSSPHLVQVRERIRINGQPISPELFTKHFWRLYHQLEKTKVPMPEGWWEGRIGALHVLRPHHPGGPCPNLFLCHRMAAVSPCPPTSASSRSWPSTSFSKRRCVPTPRTLDLRRWGPEPQQAGTPGSRWHLGTCYPCHAVWFSAGGPGSGGGGHRRGL